MRVLHKTVSRRIIKNLEGERGATKITLLQGLIMPAGRSCSQHPKVTYKCERRLHFLQAFQLRDEFIDFSCHFSVHFLWPKSRNNGLAFPMEAAHTGQPPSRLRAGTVPPERQFCSKNLKPPGLACSFSGPADCILSPPI